MTNFLYYVANVWDRKATSLCTLIEPAEVDDEAKFVAPGLGYGKTRRSPRSVHGFC